MVFGRILLPLAGLAIGVALVAEVVGLERLNLARFLPAARDSESGAGPAPTSPPAAPTGGSAAAGRTIVAEGRVVAYPGAQVVIGAETAGTIERILVFEKSRVRKGDLLVEFRAADVRAQVAEAAARLAEAEAEAGHAVLEEQRLKALLDRHATSPQEYERIHYHNLALTARRDAALAMRDRLVALLAKYRIVSPIDGVVTARFVQQAETVAIAAPLVTVLDLSRLRIEAEVDDFDIARCQLGSAVTIRSESYPDRSWRGVVEEVADVLTGRRIRPEDPGRPTDTRVLPVRIGFREPHSFKFGLRVEVEVDAGEDSPKASLAVQTPGGAGVPKQSR
jgi:multidrug resistance efflux pump